MPKKRRKWEQIIYRLRKAEVARSKGDVLFEAVRRLRIAEQI